MKQAKKTKAPKTQRRSNSNRQKSQTANDLLATADQLYQSGRLTEAEECYRRHLADHPQNETILNQLGTIAYQQGKLKEAMELFRQAVHLKQSFPLSLFNLGVTLVDMGNSAEAISLFEQAIAIKPDFTEGHFNLANALHNEGLLERAVDSYKNALTCKPDHPGALFNQGVTLNRLGRHEEAAAILQQALQKSPENHAILNNLGVSLIHLGKTKEALQYCEKAIRLQPNFAEAYHTMALAHYRTGRLQEALAAYRKSLALTPDNPELLNNTGLAYNDLGLFSEAITCYHQALNLAPGNVQIRFNLAISLGNIGKTEEASDIYQNILAQCSTHTGALTNLAKILQDTGNDEDSELLYRKVLQLDPDTPDHFFNLAQSLVKQGKPGDALVFFRRAADMDKNPLYLQGAVQCLAHPGITAPQELIETTIEICMDAGGIHLAPLVQPATSALKNQDCYNTALRAMNDGRLIELITAEELPLLKSRLLLLLLQKTVLVDPELELLLTACRRALLQIAENGTPSATKDATRRFACALAHQCFTNEYIYPVTEEENRVLQQITEKIALTNLIPDFYKIAVIGCYLPLARLNGAEDLLSMAGEDSHLQELIIRQVQEPLEEKKLKETIKELHPIHDTVSQKVRSQYEENPYPRWTDVPATGPARPLFSHLKTMFPFLPPQEGSVGPDCKILVAGCGTGREAIQASLLYRGAQITAVDLSRTSLAYAMRKSKEYKTDNIDFYHGDILDLGRLEYDFDVVMCSGVLHHMRDPMAGWQILNKLLRPGGFMKIALYSEIARQPVVSCRDFIANRGYASSPEGIRRCRQDISALPNNDPLKAITGWHDFYTMSMCRDLLFHSQEHRFSIPQIETACGGLGLYFLGFAPDGTRLLKNYQAAYPDDTTKNRLANWQQYEQAHPQSFIGMYTFWLQKPSHP